MKTLILYMFLAASGSGDRSIHLNSNNDYGLYCSADTAPGKIKITVKATYYVQRGNAEDMEALKLGIALWYRQNNLFYLLSDSIGENGQVEFPVYFDLKIKETDDPDKLKVGSDNVSVFKKAGGPLNTLRVVRELTQCEGRNDDLDSTAGLTCGKSMIQIKRGKKKTYQIVVGHEIGHTLGLEHIPQIGLMYKDNQGNNVIYESDIVQILRHSYEYRDGQYRNHFDNRITNGKIRHRLRKEPLVPDSLTVFQKDAEEKEQSND